MSFPEGINNERPPNPWGKPTEGGSRRVAMIIVIVWLFIFIRDRMRDGAGTDEDED